MDITRQQVNICMIERHCLTVSTFQVTWIRLRRFSAVSVSILTTATREGAGRRHAAPTWSLTSGSRSRSSTQATSLRYDPNESSEVEVNWGIPNLYV